jgi:4-oxalmesaconate hydratase
MIIDCHGHYTTAPKGLQAFRDAQLAELKNPPATRTKGTVTITDDEIRASLEGAQLKLQRERGSDVTIFSPRASAMAHHVGDATTSLYWSQHCNDLITASARCIRQFRRRVPAAQTPSDPLANCIAELGDA